MDKVNRIGVFGGTFDPIHKGHLAIARAAREQAELDKVLFVIAANPPHKNGVAVTPAQERVAMTAVAIADEPGFEISRVELDRPGPSYTADTLARLRDALAPAELFFIVGYDSALDMPRWRHPQTVLRLATLLVAPRPDNSSPLPPMIREKCVLLHMEEYPVSSSAIRERMARGEDMSGWLPPAVQEIIDAKGLYRADSKGA